MEDFVIAITAVLALYLAWNLGANDVANSMGTSVGSKAVTLKQALIIAGILEFTGAVVFGQEVSAKLATGIVDPALFAQTPQILLVGMVSVLISAGVWLNIATLFGFPVSSSHATVGAIAGFACVALSPSAVDWSSIGIISLTWMITPLISGTIAALFYSQIKHWILDQPDPITQLREWIPWLSAALMGIFGVIVLPTLSRPLQRILRDRFELDIPAHDLPLLIGSGGAIALTLMIWRELDQNTQAKIQNPEPLLARFQVLSACFVAFAHGSNDVGNAVSPLAAIVYITQTKSVPLQNFQVPLWILVLGGIGIVAGLAVMGKKVIATIGEGIIALQPSGGFCAELATAATILVASRLGLPVSTSHALVGGVVGIGLIQSLKSIQFKTLRSIGLTWLVTIPIAAGLSATIFAVAQFLITTYFVQIL
ncbi:inorganic phosphate transporter [Phormidesmis priestleyi ULC007]|uniref:Phosphate transporter n=1 Tax=Phormidesmis priestleyi ULC007 TaxID=1920490 RepID=A0A2T1DJ84_9CYAN|nr:inorganic phosphate transporter [Phormidesmis priestleyi]PSB20569.1 inorganic phosphate transporter [Phormidesmis priestleyi ULC007]PZO54239.1 MAG: inorganic phosphate transporter [Phormidesmis priestleyi]